MSKREKMKKLLSYVLVAVLASGATWCLSDLLPNSKLEVLETVINRRFIGTADKTKLEDAAAEAMIAALDDRWSYYISAENYAAHVNRQNNEYVGIGVAVQMRTDGKGYDVISVTADGPAEKAGVMAGDIITHVDGTAIGGVDISRARELIMGPKNTKVVLSVLRGEEVLELTVTRKGIHKKVVAGQMLTETVGYIHIANFHDGANRETIAEIEKLTEQGAEKLIFDVRNNAGGYVDEMLALLDYLLPEGTLFRSVDHNGREETEISDADCLQMPMAVLINGNTYSAAEFFAAALWEYEWAVTVGQPTTGKGHYQTTIELGDGSAVQLSIGAYSTPKGVNLTEAGGLKPDVEITPEKAVSSWEEDLQIQAAIQALAE